MEAILMNWSLSPVAGILLTDKSNSRPKFSKNKSFVIFVY